MKQKEKIGFLILLLKTGERPLEAHIYTNSIINATKHAEKRYDLDYFDKVEIIKKESVTGKPIYKETYEPNRTKTA